MPNTQIVRNWEDVIKPYLEYYNDYFSNELNIKHHILFVEGYGDCVFYNNFFHEAKEVCSSYSYEIRKRDILFDFTHKFEDIKNVDGTTVVLSVNQFGRFEDVDEENENESELENQIRTITDHDINEKRTQLIEETIIDTSGYANFSFVIKCMEELTNNQYDYLDCFGIIDLDSNQHTNIIKEIANLKQSKCHDRETTLIRCGLLNYLNSIEQQDNFELIKEKIKTTLIFAVKQGIMERASFLYENDNGQKKILNTLTHTYIKKKATKKDFSSFSFNGYINDYFITHGPYQKYDEDSNSYITINPRLEYGNIKNEFENNYLLKQIEDINEGCFNYSPPLETVRTIDSEEVVLNEYLSKAINEYFLGNTNYNGVIDTLFKYANGHIFLGQLLYKNDETEFFKDKDGNVILSTDNSGEDKLVNVIFDVNNKDNIDSAFACAPLQEYARYRNSLEEDKKIVIETER